MIKVSSFLWWKGVVIAGLISVAQSRPVGLQGIKFRKNNKTALSAWYKFIGVQFWPISVSF
jgi:hypothetical protein